VPSTSVPPAASPAAASIDEALRAQADPDRASHERAYLRSRLEHYGVGVPQVRRVARDAWRALPAGRDALLDTAAALWDEPAAAPVHERRLAAAELLAAGQALLGPADAAFLERLLREARTWALVDVLAPRTVGPLVARDPLAWAPTLDRWADDPDHWLRRASLLVHLVPLREGRGDWPRFVATADRLVGDHDVVVAKALGWVLRDTGRRRPDLVEHWLLPRLDQVAMVTRREAVKPLPDAVREALTPVPRPRRRG
jgi:3-methyladenine DNA glycosylase AlkD